MKTKENPLEVPIAFIYANRVLLPFKFLNLNIFGFMFQYKRP